MNGRQTYSRLVVLLTVVLVSAMAFASALTAAESKKKIDIGGAKIISLPGSSDVMTIAPAAVKVGQTVIWHNQGPGSLKINFITRLGIACAAPINFYADLSGHYETSVIAPGGVASICFIEPGEFEYEVKRMVVDSTGQDQEQISRGKVTVAR